MKQTAITILETDSGQFLMQLRDNIPTIQSPNQWGLFGGGMEAGETPIEGLIREIHEELDIVLDETTVQMVLIDEETDPTRRRYIFWGKISAEQLSSITLKEGQRYGLLSLDTILSGTHQNHIITPHHQKYIITYTQYTAKASA